jgi:hypothetical protein
MPGIAKMRAVVLDCPAPRVLAEFYRVLVGGDITYAVEDWVNLRDGDTVLLSFIPDRRLKVFAAAVRTCRARGA